MAGFVGNMSSLFDKTCFRAGTPMHWEHGHKAVEELKVGDRLYARDEFDPNGPIELKAIEEVFVRQGIVLELTVGGQVIGTTAEHPFYAYGRGWTPAHELTVGELIATADGRWLPIEKSYNTGNLETVYNFRIADHHTYFVGDNGWGFAVWAHNARCPLMSAQGETLSAKFVHDQYVKSVLPKAKEKTFGRGLDSRRYDAWDSRTRTAFEGNTTPWSEMNVDHLHRKLGQVTQDFLNIKNIKSGINRVVWFGSEPLPQSGLGGQIRNALDGAGIQYWVI